MRGLRSGRFVEEKFENSKERETLSELLDIELCLAIVINIKQYLFDIPLEFLLRYLM